MTIFPDDMPLPPSKPMGEWAHRANCLGLDTDMFFPELGGNGTDARKVCAACVVRADCLAYALTPPIEKSGIWGGMSKGERQRYAAERNAAL